ncbi:hypothetical protein RCL1_001624 [Eukaryota sp. TZLM3-RCL]
MDNYHISFKKRLTDLNGYISDDDDEELPPTRTSRSQSLSSYEKPDKIRPRRLSIQERIYKRYSTIPVDENSQHEFKAIQISKNTVPLMSRLSIDYINAFLNSGIFSSSF